MINVGRSVANLFNLDTEGHKRAKDYQEHKDAIREAKTSAIKHSKSFDARSASIKNCPLHQANRQKVEPLLQARGLTLNDNDQLVYSPSFKAPSLKTKTLWTVRHGQTPGNDKVMRQGVCDGPINQLNKTGKSQAENLRANHSPCDVLLCSPLGRTQYTALPIVRGELDKGHRVKISMDQLAQEKGYFNWIAHELSQSTDIGFDKNSGEFFKLDHNIENTGKTVSVVIDFRFREMSFGAKENESVHGVAATDPSHAMEYDQNAVYKYEQPYKENYMVLDESGQPIIDQETNKPIMATREIPAENFSELLLRAFDNTDFINNNFAGKDVGIVGHGIITRAMLVTRQSPFIKKDPEDQHLMIDGAQATKVPNAAMIDLNPPLDVKTKALLDWMSKSMAVRSSTIWG